MDQMTISGRWVVNAISDGNTKWCFKSDATCRCNILALDPAVNQETGASGRRYQGITLTCERVELGAVAKPTGSRWVSNNYITRCHRRFGLVGVSCSWSWRCSSRQWEPARDRGFAALSDLRLSSPAEWERSAAIVRGTWGQYVAVCSVFNSTLTHNPFVTLSQPFQE